MMKLAEIGFSWSVTTVHITWMADEYSVGKMFASVRGVAVSSPGKVKQILSPVWNLDSVNIGL